MNTKDELVAAYESWREWTEVEREAIAADDWPLLEACHQAKLKLQAAIVRLNGVADAAGRQQGQLRRELDRDLRTLVSELIVLETRNSQSLALKRQEVLAAKAELERSRFNLRQMQRSYAGQRSAAAWQQYS